MKRLVQYRIWIYETKQMIPLPPIGEEKCDGHRTGYASYTGKYTDMEWLQNTGLQDKNNEYIYEGDIVEYEFIDGHGIGYIEWIDEKARFVWIDIKDCGDGYGIHQPDKNRMEILGNIYEHPEMLEGA